MYTIPEEKLRKMSPEKRALYEARLKKVKRNRRILAAVVVFIIVALVMVVLSLTVLFKVTSVNVIKTGKIYSAQDISVASGIEIGDNILTTRFDDAENRIEELLPYVLNAKISRTLTGRISISVTDDKAEVIFAAKNGYALADINGKVLEVWKEKPKDSKYRILKTRSRENAVAGHEFGFVSEDEKNLFTEICSVLKKAGIFDDVTEIDFSESSNIKVVYKNRLRIKIGDMNGVDNKLQAAMKVIAEEEKNNPNVMAEINVRNTDKVFVKTLETLDETPVKKEKPVETTAAQTENVTDENGDEITTEPDEENTAEKDEEEKTEDEEESSEEEKTTEEDETEASDEEDSGEEEN